ncbi:YqbF domain-containing protein [Heyndrickxia sp. NPDC080065]|uniref:YqbF domain-containing protein n=1 Tax=Heyndrickxia sp. NPDC080065 TaxID=3390568 RepID=UPI003D04EE2C
MYFAKLIEGETYHVMGCFFTSEKEQQISKELYEYLKDNPQFDVRKEKKNKSEKE